MSEKKISARIMLKHDIEENWLKATGFIPLRGEVIIYEVDDNYDYERIKIGDGETPVSELPFALDAISTEDIEEILGSLDESDFAGIASPHMMRVTDADGKAKWEDRLGYAEYQQLSLVNEALTKIQLYPGFYMYLTQYLPKYPIEIGAQCTVEINGTTYESEILEYGEGGVPCIGNRHLQSTSFEDTGEPFFFNILKPGSSVQAFFSSNITAPDTAKITGPVKVYTQIPAEYIAGVKEGDAMGSVVLGGENNSATGQSAIAEGAQTSAEGIASHAEGMGTTASGHYSHSEGQNTVASGTTQHVQGRFNIEDTEEKYAHIVGNGTTFRGQTTYSNAHTLDWDGNAWYQGDVYVGGTSQANGSKLVTEAEVAALIDSKLGVTENGAY